MEDSWENWISSLEMGDDNFFGQCHIDSFEEENFLTGMVQHQPGFSLDSVSSLHHSPCPSSTSTLLVNTATTAATTTTSSISYVEASLERHGTILKSNSSNSIISQDAASHKPAASSPTTFILSFENSTVEPTLHSPSPKQFGGGVGTPSTLSSKRTMNNHSIEPKANQGTKKVRSSSEIQDHIMAERKRRQELTGSFIALSATIPGLKKTDKAYILREAVDYVKQLQERVKELENQNKRTAADSVIFIKKSQVCTKEETTSCETNSDSCYRSNKALPKVEARVLEKEVLIAIHCEKQKDIVLKIVALLNNLHLSLASSSVLPFGTSTLKVTIIAQMGDKYCMTINDLAKNLRQDLAKSHDIQQ